jgi:four helix bundle protein
MNAQVLIYKTKRMEKKKRSGASAMWRMTCRLVREIFKNVKYFPHEEIFGLAAQIKRSSVCASTNMADALKVKGSDKMKLLSISQRALSETGNYLIRSHSLGSKERNRLMTEAKKAGKILKKYRLTIKNDSGT